ncbi:hypothetical protein BaRGS_00029143 [Batillaria attramentaria]|uniref:LRRNT domain-containing protein n=1 Tax=Batillaria attramentaria TaxID=370345 RepID=A0ABD0JXZ5_9CAEN
MGKWIVLFAVLACLVLHATHGISKVRGRFQNITTRFRGYINNVTLGPQREDAFCGEGKCRCSGNVADCSGNEAGLTYIPKLPDDISIVYFSKYGLKVIDNDDFFRNVTNITVLNLSNNGLTNISEGAFRPVHRLAVLTLDANSLTYDSLVPVFT